MHRSLLSLVLLSAAAALAQDAPHWGIQSDYFTGVVPDFIVDKIDDLPERPEIESGILHAGLVRFHSNGSPNWSVEFSRTDLTLKGGLNTVLGRQEVRGDGIARGVIFTKFLNFFSKRYISGGLATGIGIGHIDASYIRYQVPPGPSVITGGDSWDGVAPLFQAVAQVDIRPIRWISLSPFYGLRNGTLGGGGAIRIHFTK